PVRRAGGARRRKRAGRARGQPLSVARAPRLERRARRARRAHPRGDERARARAGRGAREAALAAGRVTVGLLGGGVIGGGWAARFVLNGIDVRLYDPDPNAPRKVDLMLENARRALGRLTYAPLPAPGELTFVASPEAAAEGAGFIQENAPERIDLK